MELLLNEKSLDGQFTNLDDFYEVLPVMSSNLRILRKYGIPLLKHSSLYNRKITPSLTILDLQNSRGKIAPVHRDKVRKWKRELSSLAMSPPFWDNEWPCSSNSMEEAARRGTDVLSFPHEEYQDTVVPVLYQGRSVLVKSAVTKEYLLELLLEKKTIPIIDYLKSRYSDGKIRMGLTKNGIESVLELEKKEIWELCAALDRFEHETWQEIGKDRFFNYKSYQPPSKKKNYFDESICVRKIDKFRCGQHSKVRCFGYRQENLFYILAVERDHSISDTG